MEPIRSILFIWSLGYTKKFLMIAYLEYYTVGISSLVVTEVDSDVKVQNNN